MPQENIVVRGAREHNLKNINVTIPRNKLVVVTGVSGSGKSSLAFDTIYAEGQRRYVESLSAYARQFLGRMDKPDVDYIDGLSPAISIDQKGVSKNPRSTVGTVTEIYDYLRLLFARAGRPYCYKCGRLIKGQTVQQIVDAVLAINEGSRIQILAPMVARRKGEHKETFENARKSGFVRVRVDGKTVDLSEDLKLDKKKWHTIDVVVDRLVVGKSMERTRVADSVESALKVAGGTALVSIEGGEEMMFSEKMACVRCNISIAEMEPRTFSFNNPHGACPECTGLGYKLEVDPLLVIPDTNLTLSEGAVRPWARARASAPWLHSILSSLASSYGFSTSVPVKNLKEEYVNLILYGNQTQKIHMKHLTKKGRVFEWETRFEGVINRLARLHRETESDHVRSDIQRYMTSRPCQLCGGARLKREALSVKIAGLNIIEVSNKSIEDAGKWVKLISNATESDLATEKQSGSQKTQKISLSPREKTIASQILKEIAGRLSFLTEIGLDYLTLQRTSSTLSGGEAQRIRLATQIGSGLMGVLYVCDEPSVGLHPVDDYRLIDTLQRLRDLGNTILIVEHDEAIMKAADHIVDLGPGAGEHGGNVVGIGTVDQLAKIPESITGQYLSGRRSISVPKSRRAGSGVYLTIVGARENNLKGFDLQIPLGKLVCITGASGSGKSTLINEVLYKSLAYHFYRSKERPGDCDEVRGSEHLDKVVNIDQSPIGRTPRSNPATYTGVFTPIRELFAAVPDARMRGYKPGRFSFNVKGGRCEACSGDGYISIEMQFLPDVSVPCEVCNGKRYNREALEVKFRDKNISDVLEMTVSEALIFFANIPRVRSKLQTMNDVGLGYIRLGQPATTLSGGEAQRIKLSTELSRRATGKTLYIMDEPTTGLSFEDCANLLNVIHRLVDSGNSVILIEHHLDLIKNGDWIIDLGPGGGDSGGHILASGTPEEIAKVKRSHTGNYLKGYLSRTRSVSAQTKQK